MPLLYKYLPARNDKGEKPALRALNTMRLGASDPRYFNDPFEVRPWFDQERHDHAAQTTESFHSRALGVPSTLIAGRSFVGFPTENASCFAEKFNKKFIDHVSRKFRVLCLGKNPGSVLMWGHYTQSHAGIMIGIDTDAGDFPQGLRQNGFEVEYSKDRSKTKLPMAFYQNPGVESYDWTGAIANHPDEEVRNGSLTIFFREYMRQVEEAGLTALTTKAEDWQYEAEVRFIYDLSKDSKQLISVNNYQLIQIPPPALREIVVGFNAGLSDVEEIVGLFRSGKIGKPKLFFSECHPNLYEVQKHECDDKYLLDYFKVVLPDTRS